MAKKPQFGKRRSISVSLVGLCLSCLLSGSAAATTLFGLVSTGEVFASTDQGAHWTVRAALPISDAVGVGAGTISSQLFLAGAGGTLFASTDGGTSWAAVGAAPASDVSALVVASNLTLLLLTSSGTIYQSIDQGLDFTAIAAMPSSGFVSLAQSRSNFSFFALQSTGDVWRSTDWGVTWSETGGIPASDAVAVQAVGGALDLMTAAGDVYTSTNSGVTWIGLGTLSQVGMTALTHDGGTLLAGAGTGEVASSTDGRVWTWKGATNQMTLRSLGVDTPVASGVAGPGARATLRIGALWPNPARCRQTVKVGLTLSANAAVTVALYDVTGRKLADRAVEGFGAGSQTISWDPGIGAAGMYVLRLSTVTGGGTSSKLIVLP